MLEVKTVKLHDKKRDFNCILLSPEIRGSDSKINCSVNIKIDL